MRQIIASEMPVFPDVGSSTMRSFVSTPRRSASSIMYFAMRSFTLPLGFCPSSLAYRRTDGLGLIRGISTSGVLPMASIRLSYSTSAATGERGQDRDGIAFLHARIELVEVPDVFVVEVDVDEPVQRALLHDLVLEPRVTLIEIRQHFADGGPFALHHLRAGDLLQHRCHFYFDGHVSSLPPPDLR